MDIAMASIQLSMVQMQIGVGYAIAGKVMDSTEAQAEQLLEMLTQVPSFGHGLDIRV